MSEILNKEFELELDDHNKWKDTNEKSTTEVTDSNAKKKAQQSWKGSEVDQNMKNDDDEGKNTLSECRTDSPSTNSHKPDRSKDRPYRNTLRSYPYGRAYRTAISQGQYKPYNIRNFGNRDANVKSYFAGSSAPRVHRRDYRQGGYMETPKRLYYPGTPARNLGFNPNIYGYSTGLSQMYPLIKPTPFYLSPFPLMGAISQPGHNYNAMNFVPEKIFINPAKLPELQKQGLDLRVLLRGRRRQHFDYEDSVSRHKSNIGHRSSSLDTDYRVHNSDKNCSTSKQIPNHESARSNKSQQSADEPSSHWKNNFSSPKKEEYAFGNNESNEMRPPSSNNQEESFSDYNLEYTGQAPHSVTVSQLDPLVTHQYLVSIASAFPGFGVGIVKF